MVQLRAHLLVQCISLPNCEKVADKIIASGERRDKAFTIDVVAPDSKKEDFKVNVKNNILSISAKSKQHQLTQTKIICSIAEESIVIHCLQDLSLQQPESVKEDEIDGSFKCCV